MGYILPISLYQHNWKIHPDWLVIKRVEKTKLLTEQREQYIWKSCSQKESVLHDLNVSTYYYFYLTGKGRHIDLKI